MNFKWDNEKKITLLYIFGRSNFLSNRLKRIPEMAKIFEDHSYILKQKSLNVLEVLTIPMDE